MVENENKKIGGPQLKEICSSMSRGGDQSAFSIDCNTEIQSNFSLISSVKGIR